MRKLLLATALTSAVFGFTAGAQAEGDAAIRSNSSVNTDASMSSQDSGTSSAANVGSEGSTMNGENVSARTFDIDSSSDAQEIIAAQQQLRSEGYVVAVDGVWGPRTEAAIREYQSAQNTGAAASGAGEGMSMGNESSVSNSRANNSLDSAGDSGTGGY